MQACRRQTEKLSENLRHLRHLRAILATESVRIRKFLGLLGTHKEPKSKRWASARVRPYNLK